MSHAPTDFGVIAVVPPPPRSLQGSMRTGLTEALLTDKDDDSYDLSWLERLPGDPITAIGHLRRLLKDDPDPIDRHFMYCELEDRLYRSRDAFPSALEEYNEPVLRTMRRWMVSGKPCGPSSAECRCWTLTGRWQYGTRR
jgi:hypothetical protein